MNSAGQRPQTDALDRAATGIGLAYMLPPMLYVLFAVHHDIDRFNMSLPCSNKNLVRIPTRFVLGYQLCVDRTLHLEFAFLDLDECVEFCRYRIVLFVIL
jgi:hypothetical protein